MYQEDTELGTYLEHVFGGNPVFPFFVFLQMHRWAMTTKMG